MRYLTNSPTAASIAPAVLAGALCLAAPVPAGAQDLADVPEIREGLIATAIAYAIGEECGSIDARLLAGLAYLEQLRGRARELGFSDDEIEAFLEAERGDMEAEARARMRAAGVVEGQAETFCAMGRAEIASGSVTGRLLR